MPFYRALVLFVLAIAAQVGTLIWPPYRGPLLVLAGLLGTAANLRAVVGWSPPGIWAQALLVGAGVGMMIGAIRFETIGGPLQVGAQMLLSLVDLPRLIAMMSPSPSAAAAPATPPGPPNGGAA